MRGPLPNSKGLPLRAHYELGRKGLMADPVLDSNELLTLTRLFAYPGSGSEPEAGGQGAAVTGAELAAAEILPQGTSLIFANEYARPFINARPELPCPPYGSVYLEGTWMSSSTVRLRRIYWSHGFDSVEMPDSRAERGRRGQAVEQARIDPVTAH